MEWFLKVLRNYAEFSGRARRIEYWMFVLFSIIFSIVALLVDNMLGVTFGETNYGFMYLLYQLVVLIPSLAVTVRRLHDTNKSGWLLLIAVIPFVGAIWLLVLTCMEGTSGPNKYGPDPKGGPLLNDYA